MDKARQYLTLARKAGLLCVGEEACGDTASAGKARLLLLAADASQNANRRAEGFLQNRRAPLRELPWTKEELSGLMGKNGCSMLCFTDLGLAAAFAGAMAEQDPGWKETAELLLARRDKARRRKTAPRKHTAKVGKGGQKDGN